MNRVTFYRVMTLVSVPFTIAAFYIIVFVKPALARTDQSMRHVFFWFAAFSIVSGILNMRQIAIMCKTKEEKQKNEIFSGKGRYILRNSPETYFTDETIKEYKMHQRLYVVFFIISFGLLYLLLNSEKYGIRLPF